MKQPGESLLLPLFWGSVELLFREAVCGSLHWLPSWHQSAVKSISVSSGSPDLRSYYLALVDMPRGAHRKSTAAEGRQASPCLVNKVSALFTVTQIANRCKVHKQAGRYRNSHWLASKQASPPCLSYFLRCLSLRRSTCLPQRNTAFGITPAPTLYLFLSSLLLFLLSSSIHCLCPIFSLYLAQNKLTQAKVGKRNQLKPVDCVAESYWAMDDHVDQEKMSDQRKAITFMDSWGNSPHLVSI